MRVLVAGDRGYIGAVLVPFVQAPAMRSSAWTSVGTTDATSGRNPTATSSGPVTFAMRRLRTSKGSTRSYTSRRSPTIRSVT